MPGRIEIAEASGHFSEVSSFWVTAWSWVKYGELRGEETQSTAGCRGETKQKEQAQLVQEMSWKREQRCEWTFLFTLTGAGPAFKCETRIWACSPVCWALSAGKLACGHLIYFWNSSQVFSPWFLKSARRGTQACVNPAHQSQLCLSLTEISRLLTLMVEEILVVCWHDPTSEHLARQEMDILHWSVCLSVCWAGPAPGQCSLGQLVVQMSPKEGERPWGLTSF